MAGKGWVIFFVVLLQALSAGASMNESPKLLRVYGPGGPHHVLEECAELFRERHGIEVAVIKAMPRELERKLHEDGDLYYGGAEYMLEDLVDRHPDLLDLSTAENLHPRRIGVVVRKGNPHGIQTFADLSRDGIDLLDVKLERMRHFHGEQARPGQIRHFVFTGQQGVSAWLATPEIDAWVTYRSWHLWLEDEADFVEIPGPAGLRYTPMALTLRTPHRAEALQFLTFLKSSEARQIFAEHGWY
ncbi:AcfC family putative adhesin [Desulfuromonas carbonis]|uniref:substrate-binding domain-containing protein n=1 Tax=Desulfuromonas sp. DDH964 TaxID=1823759 RepID=UPI00078E2EF3|nr:substrate-binding domain-containing protein [Desulfuromonas sp. DDH964]AMV71251.1 hypothetical protein DBW_0869 [Desulfuromonas sp. DDH964]